MILAPRRRRSRKTRRCRGVRRAATISRSTSSRTTRRRISSIVLRSRAIRFSGGAGEGSGDYGRHSTRGDPHRRVLERAQEAAADRSGANAELERATRLFDKRCAAFMARAHAAALLTPGSARHTLRCGCLSPKRGALVWHHLAGDSALLTPVIRGVQNLMGAESAPREGLTPLAACTQVDQRSAP